MSKFDPDIQKAIDAHESLLARGLRFNPEIHGPASATQALAILEDDGIPMHDAYSDGGLARAPFTPRQVFTLTEIRHRPVTHEEAAYKEALAAIHEQLGRLPSAVCGGTTVSDTPCRASALIYGFTAADNVFRRCSAHTTPKRRTNAALMRTKERRLLKKALTALGMEAPGE
jgi:hypothetical protein